jgi:hypothetical protein
MNNVEKEFVRIHKKFVYLRSLSIWDGERIRDHFTKNELIVHFMLSEEMFYLWTEKGKERTLLYVREAYPDTTEEDLRNVYEANRDFICGIYG